MPAKLRKAVFPVAGFGSRFLPVTKASPKEMLPIVDKPLIQYAVEEAAARLRELVAVYDAGLAEPLPLPLRTGHAWAANPRAARPKAEAEWSRARFGPECEDEAHVRVWGPDAPLSRLLEQRPIVGLCRVVDDLDHAALGPATSDGAEAAGERLVPVMRADGQHRRGHVPRDRLRERVSELRERADDGRVVLVAPARDQPRGEEEDDRLGDGEAQRRKEELAIDPVMAAPGLKDRDAELLVQGVEVAVDGPRRDPRAAGDLGGSDPLGVTAQHRDDAQHPGQAVALAERPLLRLERHGTGAAITTSRPRSVAVSSTSILPWMASSSIPLASPLADPATWPSAPSRKIQ